MRALSSWSWRGSLCSRARPRNPGSLLDLVETNRTFTACPMSNAAIAGLRRRILATITLRQQVSARNSLLLRPSIPRRRPLPSQMGASSVTSAWYSHRASIFAGTLSRAIRPPPLPYAACVEGRQPNHFVGKQVAAMDDGGVAGISVPLPRCPPAPYERASVQGLKPRQRSSCSTPKTPSQCNVSSRVHGRRSGRALIRSAKQADWSPQSSVASRTVVTDFDKFTPAVANIIPQQKAGRMAEIAGVADRTGWCPIDPVTFDDYSRTFMSSATQRLVERCRVPRRPPIRRREYAQAQ